MQRSKKSLYIGLTGVFIVVLLTCILLIRERGELVTAKNFQYLMQTQNAPKSVRVDEKYLYFQINKKVYRVYKDSVDINLLKNLRIVDRTKNDSIYLFILLLFFIVIGIVVILRKKINFSKEKIVKKEQDSQENIKPLESDVYFEDVAGITEAKEELLDIVDFLKFPQKYQKLNLTMPKGVLLIGPPGVGKTLIAKAMAGESGVPFFYQSGASFVQIYTGMGAKRVRELFSVAKKNAPAIIFIDEIDALGKARGANRSDEREATLNELLMQMDGFSENSGVMVIGATNRVEILDDALMRSGRFDRKVFLALPNLEDRKQILKVHLRSKNFDFDLDEVAKICIGFSGAGLAVLINEAGIHALRNRRDIIYQEDILAVKDKVFLGKKMQGHLDLEQRELVGIYQSSKALSAYLLGLEYEKISLLVDLVILNDKNILSAGYLEKKIQFHLSGIFGLLVLKNERFTFGKQDLEEIKKIAQQAQEYQINLDLEQKGFLKILEEQKDKIIQINHKLLEQEFLKFDDVCKIMES